MIFYSIVFLDQKKHAEFHDVTDSIIFFITNFIMVLVMALGKVNYCRAPLRS